MQCIIPKSRTFVILVTFLDDSKKYFKIPMKQKGSTTLINITNSIAVNNKEYFGLKYVDKFLKPKWINLDKSLYQQLKKSQIDRTAGMANEPFYNIDFEVRFYPRDPTSIDNENFRYQIFLQIRKDLSTMKLVIKNETILCTICGLILQSDFGDYSCNRFAPHYIRQTISSHLLNPMLEDKIKNEHIKLKGVEPVEAEYRFLEKVRWLENYGTIIFPVKDLNNKYCYFGLNPQGFSLRYQKDQNLNYDIFWPRVSTIRRKGRQIIIKEKTDTTKKHYFETGEKLLCKVVYKLSLDHFAFFKLKRDEKPLVNEPPKRSFGRSGSKEFGYSSDTSDGNQYSDDTFSSYPDSINTTHSSKTSKGFNKASIPLRNCISDVEELALSRKNRRVIVSKSQTETEDDEIKFNDNSTLKFNRFDFDCLQSNKMPSLPQSRSFDRIPPDYIYENRLPNPTEPASDQSRKKKMRKRAPTQSHTETKNRSGKETESTKEMSDKSYVWETEFHSPPLRTKLNEAGLRPEKSKSSNNHIDTKTRVPRQLPSTNVTTTTSESIVQNQIPLVNYRINQSASVDSISSNMRRNDIRVSPTKRILPNLSEIASANSAFTTSITRHRSQPKIPFSQHKDKTSPTLYADIWYKPAYATTSPIIPQYSNQVQRKSRFNDTEKVSRCRSHQRPNPKHHSQI